MGSETRTYEGYGRLGKDWNSERPFFNDVPSLLDMGHLILKALGERDVDKIHNLTCGVTKFETKSITGDFYLTEKCIRYKIEVSVEAELVNDAEAEEGSG